MHTNLTEFSTEELGLEGATVLPARNLMQTIGLGVGVGVSVSVTLGVSGLPALPGLPL